MQCHQGNMTQASKFPKYFIEFYLFFILVNLSMCISIHPMGRYSNFPQEINHLSTVQPQYPWTNAPLPSEEIDHGYYDKSKSKTEKEGSFSDIFGENRRVEIQAFSNIFGQKLIQTKPKPKNLARNTQWATSGLDVFSQSDEDQTEDAENLNHSRLNVLHPNSPYGLIQHVISPNLPKQRPSGNQRVSDLGGLNDDEVWLSDGDLLILKGGTTSFLSNSIDDSNPYKSRPTSNPNEDIDKNTPVTYANSGKLAIAPAPPSVASNYVNHRQNINLKEKTTNNVALTRVPKYINSKFEPFVPKNAQIPWPETHDSTQTNNLPNPPRHLQPVQNKFRPSELIRKQDSSQPKVHQYKIQFSNPSTYGTSLQTGKLLSVPNSNHNTQSHQSVQLPISPVYTPSHNAISSNAISLPSATNPIIKHLSRNHNRKIYNYRQAPVIQYQEQELQKKRQSGANPLLEYLRIYAIRNKRPLSSLTGNSQHFNHGKAAFPVFNSAGSIPINSPVAAQQRTPKAFTNVRNQLARNQYNLNNPYVSTRQAPINNYQPFLPKPNPRPVYTKSLANYVKKKTPFLEYLTYIKPYLPNFTQ